jgi:hypothetical protein
VHVLRVQRKDPRSLRCAQDPRSVITTYEGKHNRDLPVGRNSSQIPANSITQNLGQVLALQLKQEHEIT